MEYLIGDHMWMLGKYAEVICGCLEHMQRSERGCMDYMVREHMWMLGIYAEIKAWVHGNMQRSERGCMEYLLRDNMWKICRGRGVDAWKINRGQGVCTQLHHAYSYCQVTSAQHAPSRAPFLT